MTRETATVRPKRSAESRRFESVVRSAGVASGVLPRLADIDFAKMPELVPWIAVIDPNTAEFSLKFAQAGAGISQFLGRDAVGLDYLDIVDPAFKGDAFDSAFLMLTRPCGLWQQTPGIAADGAPFTLELTGFPVYDHVRARGQILLFIKHGFPADKPLPRAAQTQHSTVWYWLEMKSIPQP